MSWFESVSLKPVGSEPTKAFSPEQAAFTQIGAMSPLWLLFMGASTAGIAYWSMTRWMKLATPERMAQLRQQLAADLASGWDGVAPRPFDFDGDTFRKPGGIAPQMVWDKKTNQMTLEIYIGANPALPVPTMAKLWCRPLTWKK